MAGYLRFLTRCFVFTILGLSLVWLVFWLTQGAKVYSVQTGSMVPTLRKGDLVIDKKINAYNLSKGQVISYQSSQTPGETITHRIVSINYSAKYLITKGDNLTTPDPPVKFNQITGKTLKAIPKAGYMFDELHKPLGLVGFIYLPALLIAFSEMWFLAGKFKSPEAYQLI